MSWCPAYLFKHLFLINPVNATLNFLLKSVWCFVNVYNVSCFGQSMNDIFFWQFLTFCFTSWLYEYNYMNICGPVFWESVGLLLIWVPFSKGDSRRLFLCGRREEELPSTSTPSVALAAVPGEVGPLGEHATAVWAMAIVLSMFLSCLVTSG